MTCNKTGCTSLIRKRDTKYVGYGIRKARSRKTRALPSVPNVPSKTVYPLYQLRLADSVHFRAPEKWRGKINSKRVRSWFKQFLLGQVALSSNDPGPGALELSVRIPRGALNKAAEGLKMPGAVLLRRLIAAQIEPVERARAPEPMLRGSTPILPAIPPPGSVPLMKSVVQLAAGAMSSLATKALFQGATARENRTPLQIVSTVSGYRSLGEIGRALRTGEGITDEELIRWRAANGEK